MTTSISAVVSTMSTVDDPGEKNGKDKGQGPAHVRTVLGKMQGSNTQMSFAELQLRL